MKKLFLTVFALVAFLTACEKSDHLHGTDDVFAPSIELLSPLNGDVYHIGDTVHIKGRIWDNNDLHEAGILVSNDHAAIMDCPMHVHEIKEHHFDTLYVVNKSDLNQAIKITVKAEDHDHNKNEKVIDLLVE